MPCLSLGGSDEAARIYHSTWQRGYVAGGDARAAV